MRTSSSGGDSSCPAIAGTCTVSQGEGGREPARSSNCTYSSSPLGSLVNRSSTQWLPCRCLFLLVTQESPSSHQLHLLHNHQLTRLWQPHHLWHRHQIMHHKFPCHLQLNLKLAAATPPTAQPSVAATPSFVRATSPVAAKLPPVQPPAAAMPLSGPVLSDPAHRPPAMVPGNHHMSMTCTACQSTTNCQALSSACQALFAACRDSPSMETHQATKGSSSTSMPQ
ncbi:guanine nucleotide-binding protein G(olf) subunit alpha [Sarotherodon galilaeus]